MLPFRRSTETQGYEAIGSDKSPIKKHWFLLATLVAICVLSLVGAYHLVPSSQAETPEKHHHSMTHALVPQSRCQTFTAGAPRVKGDAVLSSTLAEQTHLSLKLKAHNAHNKNAKKNGKRILRIVEENEKNEQTLLDVRLSPDAQELRVWVVDGHCKGDDDRVLTSFPLLGVANANPASKEQEKEHELTVHFDWDAQEAEIAMDGQMQQVVHLKTAAASASTAKNAQVPRHASVFVGEEGAEEEEEEEQVVVSSVTLCSHYAWFGECTPQRPQCPSGKYCWCTGAGITFCECRSYTQMEQKMSLADEPKTNIQSGLSSNVATS